MKRKTLHVVSSVSVQGTLRLGFGKMNIKDEVSYLPINLSFGYIPKDLSDKELGFALASITHHRPSYDHIKHFCKLKQFFSINFSAYDKIIVWHGGAAADLLLLYLMSVIVKNNLYQIDIRDSTAFMEKQPSSPCVYTGNICPDDVIQYNMRSLAKPLSKEEMQLCRKQWRKWKNRKSPFRLYDVETGDIKAYSENFMDSEIIKSAKKHSNIFQIVGDVMRKGNDRFSIFIPDSVINRRIYHLILRHKLEVSVSVAKK